MIRTERSKTVIFYKDEKGKVPVSDWLYSIKDMKFRRRILRRLRHLEQGHYGDCKSIIGHKGLYELRFNFGPGFRLYFAEKESTLVIVLVGGDKKTQKKDISRALEYWNDYQENNENETSSDTR